MSGWGWKNKSGPGSADFDNPSPEVREKRRQADIEFLQLIRMASKEELTRLADRCDGWRLVAVERRLAKFPV